VCGIAADVGGAVSLALREKPDLAVIDMRLADGGLGTEIANQLKGRHKLGILYATGNASNVILTTDHGHACISKPYSEAGLIRALDVVTQIVATGEAPLPFPKGFKVLPDATQNRPSANG